MQKVYIVHHVHELSDLEDDEKLIGIYGSRDKAELAIGRMKKLPGFKDSPDDFVISEYILDQDHWTEGFVTWMSDEEGA